MPEYVKQNLGDIVKGVAYLAIGFMWVGQANAERNHVKQVLLELNKSKLDEKVFEKPQVFL